MIISSLTNLNLRRLVPRSAALARRTLATHDARGESQYEDYDKTSQTYDAYRAPIGVEIFRRGFAEVAARTNQSTNDLHLMDAGCGSGNHLDLLQHDVGSIAGLEINNGMLDKCRAKLSSSADIRQGSITDMPFEDESADVVITTQVLHHLETGGDLSFPNVAAASREVFRCLRPGGSWIIQCQTPEQHVDGFWWSPIVPVAAAKLATRFPSLVKFEELCRAAGFNEFDSEIPSEPLVRLDMYLDLEGPFDERFRNADSTWSLATEAELESGLTMLRRKIDNGTAEKWLHEREELRAQIGQTTTVIVSKV